MAARKKLVTDLDLPHHDTEEADAASRPILSNGEHSAAPSPARALQAGLEAEYARRDFPFTQMQVMSGLVVFCFAVWWALFQVVAVIA